MDANPDETILWERLDRPGHESARLRRRGLEMILEGSAVFAHEGAACRLDYLVVADGRFHTLRGRVGGWLGERAVEIELVAEAGRWSMNGAARPEVDGAIDLDLNFSPSTNLLPIRRLQLEVGQEAPVRAAWLRFPSFELEPFEQTYRRLDPSRYSYRSDGGFEAELDVRPSGFVTLYPGLARVSGSR
jgi:hypothetical protein